MIDLATTTDPAITVALIIRRQDTVANIQAIVAVDIPVAVPVNHRRKVIMVAVTISTILQAPTVEGLSLPLLVSMEAIHRRKVIMIAVTISTIGRATVEGPSLQLLVVAEAIHRCEVIMVVVTMSTILRATILEAIFQQ